MFDLERPFHRLIHHYVTRIFRGAGDGDDLQFSIPALLGLLSVPSGFGSILLLDKYSTLRMYFMGIRHFDVYRASFYDEYFFIVYSMVITGSVVVLKWDRLFPDRQDFDNLAVLPISGRQNFAASLIALLFLTSLFAAIVNGAASVVFPYAVTNSYESFPVFAEFFVAHLTSVLLASFFTCFGLLAVMGITIMIVPKRFVRVTSLLVRITCVLGLAGMLASVFTLPGILRRQASGLRVLHSVGVVSGSASDHADRRNGTNGYRNLCGGDHRGPVHSGDCCLCADVLSRVHANSRTERPDPYGGIGFVFPEPGSGRRGRPNASSARDLSVCHEDVVSE
jgi:hypothetical protein